MTLCVNKYILLLKMSEMVVLFKTHKTDRLQVTVNYVKGVHVSQTFRNPSDLLRVSY